MSPIRIAIKRLEERLFMDIFKSNIVVGLAAGIAATILAPVVVPMVAMAARPLTKSLLKGGVILYEKGREAIAGAGEEMEDLIAEVRSELERKPAEAGAASDEHAGGERNEAAGNQRTPDIGVARRQSAGDGAQV
jgi:hypothetical protein